jgi:hypothetical protein
MARKMGDIYEDMLNKAKFFSKTTVKVFESVGCFRYLQPDSLMKGFFFFFIYKDFVLREILALMNEVLHSKISQLLFQVEREYHQFMQTQFVEWATLLLECGVFQSYSSIVTPNQSQFQEFKKKSDGSKIIVKAKEG